MPVSSAAQNTEDPKPKAPKFLKYLRLRRFGAHGEKGLAQFYKDGKLYRRSGIYRITDRKRFQALMSTRRFEVVDEELLEDAKREAKQARGISLGRRVKERLSAQRAQRRGVSVDQVEQAVSAEEDGEGFEV